MNFTETEWFDLTQRPVYHGVYRTRHRGSDGLLIEGFAKWDITGKRWCGTRETVQQAAYQKYGSTQQSKEWRGLVRDET